MGNTYGYQAGNSSALGFQVIVDGDFSKAKTGGVTIDWTTVPAASSSAVTLPDGQVIPANVKYMRYGTFIDLIGTAEVQSFNLAGSASGTFLINVTGNNGIAATTAPIAYNASAAAVQAALEATDAVDQGDVVVTLSSTTYTLTWKNWQGNVPAVSLTTTGLDAITSATVTTSTAGVGTGLYGPVATNVSDGRQTMARGETYFLNRTIREDDPASNHPAVFEGGKVRLAMMLTNENAPALNYPTEANVLTALPELRFVRD